jgi:glycerol-3-phosphate acyltransferase PlsY
MNEIALKIAFLFGAYLMGSIPFGFIVIRASRGLDIRQHGSGGIGFTNVIRVGGKKEGAVVLLLDIGKGLGVVLLARHVVGAGDWIGSIPLAAVVGHNYPIYLRFNAKGKGVATAFGAFLGLMPYPALLALLAWVAGIKYHRLVSVSSMVATTSASMWGVIFGYPDSYIVFSLLTALLVIYRHKENVERLEEGREHKWGERAGTE